tara:strand:+ start:89 stop:1099 length:1011 start_codon:yes stop_codon:yes gene_type:complete
MEKNLILLIEKFESWYNKDEHKVNIDKYDSTVTRYHLEQLNREEFIKFFIQFRKDGGKVQSLGHRGLSNFELEIGNNYLSFRKFVLEPFDKYFNLKNWFERIENHKYFGVGIATIYLNRVDRSKYPIINGKTIQSLKLLCYELSSSKNYKNYSKVKTIQSNLISRYSIFENFYKIDSFNHYIIGTKEGKEAITEFLISNDFFEIENNINLSKTEKESLILCRIGQGNFRKNLIDLWGSCSVSDFKETTFLIASHIKPWKDSNQIERLDKFNGLLLIPNLDKAFDQGLISFDELGKIKISNKLNKPEKLGIYETMKIKIKEENKPYLFYHRKNVFKK